MSLCNLKSGELVESTDHLPWSCELPMGITGLEQEEKKQFTVHPCSRGMEEDRLYLQSVFKFTLYNVFLLSLSHKPLGNN